MKRRVTCPTCKRTLRMPIDQHPGLFYHHCNPPHRRSLIAPLADRGVTPEELKHEIWFSAFSRAVDTDALLRRVDQ